MTDRRRRVGLATSISLTPSDQQLVQPLATLGFIAEPVIWSDDNVDWTSYDVVVIRSCWDYHRRVGEFLRWVGRLEGAGVRLLNAPAIVRWNSSKTYLLELGAKGIPIPPTSVIRRGAAANEIDAALSALAVEVVVKPAVSASATDTWRARLPLAPETRDRLTAMTSRGDVIVQSFVDQVIEVGEVSLVFFDGVYSHGARKFPRSGDFRVQVEHGGRTEIEEPDPSVIAQAYRALSHAPAIPTYARVDGIVIDGVFTLMELELIEPELYLFQVPAAASRFAAAIAGNHLILDAAN